MTTRRRSAVVLLVTGATCLAGAVLPLVHATAAPEPGSGLGSWDLKASAPGLQVAYTNPDYLGGQCAAVPAGALGCGGELNSTESSLRNGPIGHSLASVVWPGSLMGNLGTLLVVGFGAPDQATALNDPVKAENFTGGKQETVDFDSIPGVRMEATATPTKVSAVSGLAGGQAGSVGSFGALNSHSTTSLVGPDTAQSLAHSEISNLTIGPLEIKSIVSDARATTDGKGAKVTGGTTIGGATVAGVGVTIDGAGVHVANQSSPGFKTLTDQVNTALKQAGLTVSVGEAEKKQDGPTLLYTTGALKIVWKIPASPTGLPPLPNPPPLPVPVPNNPVPLPDPQVPGTMTMVAGAAQVSVDSTEGYSFDDGSAPAYYGGNPSGGTTRGTYTTGVPPLSPGSYGGTVGTTTGGASGPGPVLGGPQRLASVSLPHSGLSPWLVVFAVLGCGFIMAGLRRLPTSVLATSASSCPRGDLA